MTYKVEDRVLETSTTTGTGTYTLAGAPTGYQSFSTMGIGNHCPYFATDGVDWEAGIGEILSGPSRLARTTVISSSNGDAAVNWVAGTKNLRCGVSAWRGVPRVNTVSIAGAVGTQALTQDQMRCETLMLTGAITGARTVEFDATPWNWRIINNTSGAFAVYVKLGANSTLLPPGRMVELVNDGTYLYSSSDDVMPVGAMLDFAGSSAPSSYLLCDGSVVAQATYPKLYGVIGSTWNTGGEGGGNFRLPDFRRRVAMGSGGSAVSGPANTLGSVGGAETHALVTGELASHSHSGSSSGASADHSHSGTTGTESASHSHLMGGSWQTYGAVGLGSSVLTQLSDAGTGTENAAHTHSITTGGMSADHNHAITVGSTGSGTAHNNVQPSVVVTKIIKAY